MVNNVILSYPRSGNHLMRFFIELLSEIPTYGANMSPEDVEIYKNKFPVDIPFNIKTPVDESQIYHKRHHPTNDCQNAKKLIFILRNPREVLLREHKQEMVFTGQWNSFDVYFKCIHFFTRFQGEKIIFYYEEMLEKPAEFVQKLYKFLNINNPEKLKYALDNIDFLCDMSKCGEGRAWGGVHSNSTNFYYPQISGEKKLVFDGYLRRQFAYPAFKFIRDHYNIN